MFVFEKKNIIIFIIAVIFSININASKYYTYYTIHIILLLYIRTYINILYI